MTTDSKFKAVLLLGGPGSGKGTQGAVLGGLTNICHLAMGDIFRGLDKTSEIGKEFLSYSTQGLLVPDELTVRVWQAHVGARVASGALRPQYHTLLLDGIPRTLRQVELMRDHIEVLRVVHLVIRDRAVLVERLKGRAQKSARPDDAKESVILERLRVYDDSTAPVLSAYDPAIISEIAADQAPLAVLRDVAACLAPHLPALI